MSFAPRRILLLMDNRADANWGSQATTSELVSALKREYPDAAIRGIRRSEAGRVKWRRSIGKRLAAQGVQNDWRFPTQLGGKMLAHGWLDAIDWADFVVVNGEGTLHPGNQGRKWIPLLDFIRRRAKGPLWIVNCSIQLGDPPDEVFDAVFKRIERIVCREPITFELGQKHGWSIEQGADCAFLAKPAEEDALPALLSRIGVEGPYAVATGSAKADGWTKESATQWFEAIRARVPNIIWASSTIEDRRLRAEICPDLPMLSENELGYRELISLIDGAQLHFGGRFHPTIFAAMTGTPFMTLASNTSKMQGLVQILETDERIFGPTEVGAIVEKIESLDFAKKNEILRKRCQNLSVKALRNVAASPN